MMGGNTRHNHTSYRPGSIRGSAPTGRQTAINETENKKTKVFITYHFDGDRSKVALLQHQTKTSDTLDVEDVSLKEEVKSNDWKPEAKKQIANSDQVIVAVGKDTAERKAVKWEIMEALRQGKPVIVVRLNGDANDPLPENVKETATVTWNLEDIQKEIDKKGKKPREAR